MNMNMKSLAWLALACAAGQATADGGQFIQYDHARSGQTMVAVQSIGNLQIGGVYSRWSDSGKSLGLSLTQRVHSLPLADTALQLRAGLTALRHEDDTGTAATLGLKLGAEHFAARSWGSTYTLMEASTAFRSWLGVVQYTLPDSPLGLEWSAVGDARWYVGHRLALRYAIPGSAWTLRAGRQFEGSHAVFVGLSYNTL